MKMKSFIGFMMILACAVSAEQIIANWNFNQGSLDSTDQKFQAMSRGETRISGTGAERALTIGAKGDTQHPEGLVLKQKYPELSPKGAFGFRTTFRLREGIKAGQAFLWDSKYINYGPFSTNKQYHHGFCILLKVLKDGRFVPQAQLGHGTFSSVFNGKPVKIEGGRKYRLVFEYDGIDTGTLKIDDRVNAVSKYKKPGRDISPAFYQMSIGDRIHKYHYCLNGDIFDMTIYKP